MIHQYKNNGYNIVMDVNSGSIHVVDDIVYDMIPLVEPLVNEGIKDADTIKAAVLNLANETLFAECTAVSVVVFAVFYAIVYGVTAKEYYRIVN